jgi:hypothetical protein
MESQPSMNEVNRERWLNGSVKILGARAGACTAPRSMSEKARRKSQGRVAELDIFGDRDSRIFIGVMVTVALLVLAATYWPF